MNTKIKPKITRLFTRATMIGVIAVALSFFLPIVPCTRAPGVAEATFKPGLCKLPNPFVEQIAEFSTRYYGINIQPMAGLILQFIAVVIIILVLFGGIKRKAKKILDLTPK